MWRCDAMSCDDVHDMLICTCTRFQDYLKNVVTQLVRVNDRCTHVHVMMVV